MQISISHIIYIVSKEMNIEKRNPFKRDQALNGATSGRMGGEPKSDDVPGSVRELENSRQKAAPKIPKDE
ncbi:MAG: hypothetical protein ACRD4W_02155 [Nitrososphaeraceae archaeon]